MIAALGADAFFIQGDAAQGAAVDLVLGDKFRRSGIDTAGKGDLGDVQLVLQQILIMPSTVRVSLVTTRRQSG